MTEIVLANPRGFCAGVDRAIEIVERALDLFGKPVYVRHEVVHNRYVVDCLRDKGAVFIEELDEAPTGAIVIFSAHGVSKEVQRDARERGLRVFDATCPLVTKVHLEVARHARSGRDVILIGHAGHPEVEGTLGQYPEDADGAIYLIENVDDVASFAPRDPDKLAYVTQTTLSVDDTQVIVEALQARFPNLMAPKKDDICYATQNRQDAVKSLAARCDVVLVVGSPNSSNSNRLREVAERMGATAYLIDHAQQIDDAWLVDKSCIGVTAGASAPEVLVEQVVKHLQAGHNGVIAEFGNSDEGMVFPVPGDFFS